MLFRVVVTSVCLFSLGVRAADAQVTTAAIYGRVVDADGGVVQKAAVTLLNTETGVSTSAATDERGEFTFPFVPVGRYDLRAEASGFRAAVENGMRLAAGQVLRPVLRLAVGEVSTSVTVAADPLALNAVSAEQRDSKDEQHVRELPLPLRDWTSLLTINTGVALRNSQTIASLNGLAPYLFTFTIDGVDASSGQEYNSFGADAGYQLIKGISLEAIEEVSTRKGIFTAETSNTISGNVNVISKSGSNTFRGSGFWTNQIESYNARNPFLSTNPDLTFNEFGGSVGGPLVRDRSFFFVTYDGYERSLFAPVSGDVPSPEFRARALAAVPAYRPILDLFPEPTITPAAGASSAPFNGAASVTGSDHTAVVRIDQYLAPGTRITGRYIDARPGQSAPTVQPENPRSHTTESRAFAASLIHGWSALVSETRVGYQHNTTDRLDGRYGLGVPGIAGAMGFSSGDAEILTTTGSAASIDQVFWLQRGRHTLKFGGIWSRSTAGRTNIEQPIFTYRVHRRLPRQRALAGPPHVRRGAFRASHQPVGRVPARRLAPGITCHRQPRSAIRLLHGPGGA